MALFVMFLGRLGVVDSLANFIKEGGVFFTGSLAFISGNILNNIPMTMFFADILGKIADPGLLIYSVVIASNICAFLTPIGSLSGIMFMKILKRNKVDFSFKEFITYGAVIAVPTLLAALLVIQL
jgi:Na+/H+ antiporter NhaD/arsenite permease-like protein